MKELFGLHETVDVCLIQYVHAQQERIFKSAKSKYL